MNKLISLILSSSFLIFLFVKLVSASPPPPLDQKLKLAADDDQNSPRAFFKNEKASHSSVQFQLPSSDENDLNEEKEQFENSLKITSSSFALKSQTLIPRLLLLKDPSFPSRVRLTFPHHTPIINQLNLIDTLFKTQFPEVDTPLPLMTEHLKFLRISCRELARQHGPLNPQAHNCAERFNELKLFLNLLSKYKTNFQVPTIARRTENFCIHLKNALQQLRFLVDQTFTEHKIHLNGMFMDLENNFIALKDFGSELKKLDESVDSIDMDLNMYCGTNYLNSASLKQARNIVNRYLLLAFASI